MKECLFIDGIPYIETFPGYMRDTYPTALGGGTEK